MMIHVGINNTKIQVPPEKFEQWRQFIPSQDEDFLHQERPDGAGQSVSVIHQREDQIKKLEQLITQTLESGDGQDQKIKVNYVPITASVTSIQRAGRILFLWLVGGLLVASFIFDPLFAAVIFGGILFNQGLEGEKMQKQYVIEISRTDREILHSQNDPADESINHANN